MLREPATVTNSRTDIIERFITYTSQVSFILAAWHAYRSSKAKYFFTSSQLKMGHYAAAAAAEKKGDEQPAKLSWHLKHLLPS